MEKRREKRFKVENGWKAVINQKEEFPIKDISLRGVCLECTSSLTPNNHCTIEIDCGEDTTILTKGMIIRSFLKRMYREARESLPLYNTGIEFVDLDDREKIALQNLIMNAAGSQEP